MFINLIPSKSTAHDGLKFIYENKLVDMLPNVSVALRILLTIPITVASGERSFSKLKLIKTYLRSTMTQERLNSLALISIEKVTAALLDYSELIQNCFYVMF